MILNNPLYGLSVQQVAVICHISNERCNSNRKTPARALRFLQIIYERVRCKRKLILMPEVRNTEITVSLSPL
jgi:hypothetical protein